MSSEMRELAQDVRNRFFWRVSPDDKRNHLIDDDAVRAVVSLCDALLARTEAGVCEFGGHHDWRGDDICDRCGEGRAAPVADGKPGSVAKRKRIELEDRGYVVNGVCFKHPESGARGMLCNGGSVHWLTHPQDASDER